MWYKLFPYKIQVRYNFIYVREKAVVFCSGLALAAIVLLFLLKGMVGPHFEAKIRISVPVSPLFLRSVVASL